MAFVSVSKTIDSMDPSWKDWCRMTLDAEEHLECWIFIGDYVRNPELYVTLYIFMYVDNGKKPYKTKSAAVVCDLCDNNELKELVSNLFDNVLP